MGIRWSTVPAVSALFATVLTFAVACRTAPAVVAADPKAARGEDARLLPEFDIQSAEGESAESPERFYLELRDAPVRGPADAPVTVVMFSDFECPFCQRGHATVETLSKRYAGKIRIAYKAFPLDMHSNALLAAMAARTAQAQGKFWEFHDQLFSQRGLDVRTLITYAEEVGIDLGTLKRDLAALEYGPEVRRDMRQGRRLGVSSTPTFFINGRVIQGAQKIDAFDEVIKQELASAKKWRAEGVAADQIYAHAIKDGFKRVVYTERSRGLDPDAVVAVPIGKSPVRGPADAPVTIVEFGDFECPFCTRGNETVEALRKLYGDKLRIVYKHNPLSFHSHAFIAARASMAAAAQGKFWQFHDALYELEAQFDEDDVVKVARKVRLNMKKFFKAMSSTELDEAIAADQGLAMALGVTGTPAFFVNGRPIEGALPELQFRLLIEEELDRARAARARGVAPDKLYETLSSEQLAD